MMDAVISLCGSEDVTHQQVAVEALIHAAGKAKRASFITANGVALLKELYKNSDNDRIRVRALVVSNEAGRTAYLHLEETHRWLFCRVYASWDPLEERISA